VPVADEQSLARPADGRLEELARQRDRFDILASDRLDQKPPLIDFLL
jgi:hypothetical protein